MVLFQYMHISTIVVCVVLCCVCVVLCVCCVVCVLCVCCFNKMYDCDDVIFVPGNHLHKKDIFVHHAFW